VKHARTPSESGSWRSYRNVILSEAKNLGSIPDGPQWNQIQRCFAPLNSPQAESGAADMTANHILDGKLISHSGFRFN